MYANADFANAKNAKIILHKHEKQRKNTRKHTHAQQSRKRARISEKTAEKRKKRDDIQRANDEHTRINGINARRKLLLYIDLVQLYYLQLQKMQMQILHSFALSCYANADFATRLHYVYEFVFVYVFV